MQKISRQMRTVFALLAALAFLVSCASNSDNAAKYSSNDLMFADMMIPHHEQAVVMSEMANNVEVSGETTALATEIISAQASEIELMQGFLSEWGVEYDSSSDPHAGHMMSGDESYGMMTDEELAELENSMGSGFEKMWLTMMLAHHKGAIKMAETVIADGKDTRVKTLAETIISAQQKEIELINLLLANLGN